MGVQECFWVCWNELEKSHWREFSLEQVTSSYPHLSLDLIHAYFPEKKEFLSFFFQFISHSVPAYEGVSTKDLCFELIMARLEALAPYKKTVLDIFLNSTADETLVLGTELYRYFCAHLKTKTLPYPICFYAGALIGIYRLVFPCWATRPDEEVMVYLDQLLSKALSFVE